MKNIKGIFMCPECKSDLTDQLKCSECGSQYSYKHGVYNLISLNLSGKQLYLYKKAIPDDESGMERQFNDIFPNKDASDEQLSRTYYARMNQETLDAQKKQNEHMHNLLRSLSGDICDLATGGGTMLQMVIDANNENVNIVCTDINEFELICTRIRRNKDHDNIYYIATDGRYLSLKDKSFDYIVSLAGFGNIPENDKVAKELYRILKPNGKIIIQGGYIEKDSKSYELAISVGIERGVVEEYVMQDLKEAGFGNITSTIISEAVWAENPYDLVPAAGDIQRYCVIQAERKS
jgi:ubiquinone/menaquinone biosynthesis C-methylase UbiE